MRRLDPVRPSPSREQVTLHERKLFHHLCDQLTAFLITDENALRFWQEIYNEHGELVERHVKYPVDSGHLQSSPGHMMPSTQSLQIEKHRFVREPLLAWG